MSKLSILNNRFQMSFISILLAVLIIIPLVLSARSAETQTPSKSIQTSSQMAQLGYTMVAQIMSQLNETGVNKKGRIVSAIRQLHLALANHLQNENVPSEVIEQFKKNMKSVELLFRTGAIEGNKLGNQIYEIVKQLSEVDQDGKVSSEVLEKLGLSKETINQVQQNNGEQILATKFAQKIMKVNPGAGNGKQKGNQVRPKSASVEKQRNNKGKRHRDKQPEKNSNQQRKRDQNKDQEKNNSRKNRGN